MITTSCFMDLTKRTKIKGLSTTSWFAIIIIGFIAWFFLLLYALIVVSVCYILFFILELFDEDIYEIINAKMKIPTNKYYA
nr:hypothetical protein [Campylobacter anatolicus]